MATAKQELRNVFNFRDYPSNPINGGIQYVAKFDNNRGASIVQHDFSYGNRQGLWELAVTKYKSETEWSIDYSTPITDDVMGFLSEDEVNNVLLKISQLD